MYYVLGFVAVAVVGMLSYSPFSGRSAANPKFPLSTHSAASDVMQAVCNAHGHLQRLAEHPSDPVTAFSLLGLDPNERPFYPYGKSHRKWDEWHQELLELVDKRYMGFLEREGEASGRDGGDGEQYKLALTAASDLLSKDSPRRFYVEAVLPALKNVLRGQPAECVWPRAREFNRKLCAATWATTGMLGLADDGDEVRSAHSGCF